MHRVRETIRDERKIDHDKIADLYTSVPETGFPMSQRPGLLSPVYINDIQVVTWIAVQESTLDRSITGSCDRIIKQKTYGKAGK